MKNLLERLTIYNLCLFCLILNIYNLCCASFSMVVINESNKYHEDDIINDVGNVFYQAVGIPKGTNCAPLLSNIFLYSCEVEKKHLVSRFHISISRTGTYRWRVHKENRSTEGCSKLKRSVDMTSSGKNGLNIRTNARPKWDRTRCPEE